MKKNQGEKESGWLSILEFSTPLENDLKEFSTGGRHR
jgi:hypothetical protein